MGTTIVTDCSFCKDSANSDYTNNRNRKINTDLETKQDCIINKSFDSDETFVPIIIKKGLLLTQIDQKSHERWAIIQNPFLSLYQISNISNNNPIEILDLRMCKSIETNNKSFTLIFANKSISFELNSTQQPRRQMIDDTNVIEFVFWSQESLEWEHKLDAVTNDFDKTGYDTRSKIWYKFDREHKDKLQCKKYLPKLIYVLIALHIKTHDRNARPPPWRSLSGLCKCVGYDIQTFMINNNEFLTKNDFVKDLVGYLKRITYQRQFDVKFRTNINEMKKIMDRNYSASINVQRLKLIKQSTQYLIHGYIRKCGKVLFSNDECYYNIPQLVDYTVLLYYDILYPSG